MVVGGQHWVHAVEAWTKHLQKQHGGAHEAVAGAGATGCGEHDGNGDQQQEPNTETKMGHTAGDVGAGEPVDGGAVQFR